MTASAKIFIEQSEGLYAEIGDLVASGGVDFYSGISSFSPLAVHIKPLKKKKTRKKISKASPFFGRIAILVSTNKKSFWDKEILSDRRNNFRIAYPDGETHTLSCIAIAPGGHDPYLHIQLNICAKPLIEKPCADTTLKLQAFLDDLNSP